MEGFASSKGKQDVVDINNQPPSVGILSRLEKIEQSLAIMDQNMSPATKVCDCLFPPNLNSNTSVCLLTAQTHLNYPIFRHHFA
jgi:hypothetical protein